MAETLFGKIISVDVNAAGSVLLEGATAGATSLPVANVFDFTPDGGTVSIDGELYPYTAIDEGLDDGGTLTLGSPLLADVESETRILLEPYAETKIARVTLEDGGDALSVIVPHALTALLDVGQREEDNAETVVMEARGIGELLVADIVGLRATLNPDAAPPPTDGDAPAGSPDAFAVGTIGMIFVRWMPITNSDSVIYQVHIGTSPDFVADETTLVTITAASSTTIKVLPNGDPLAYDEDYYFKIIATDDDGAAAPGLVSSAVQLRRASGPDIAADYVYAGNVIADQIIGGTINADLFMAGSIKTAEAGARVELGPFGFVVYNAAGVPTTILGSDGISTFKGSVIASTFSVTDGMSIRGTNNELAQAGSIKLAAGISAAANAPTVVNDYEIAPAWQSGSGNPWPAGYEFKCMQRVGSKWFIGARQTSTDEFFGRTWNEDGTFDAYYGVGWVGQQIQRCAYVSSNYPIYAFRGTDRRIVAATHSVSAGGIINSLSWDFASNTQPAGSTEVGTVSYSSGSVKIDANSVVQDSSLESTAAMDMRGKRVTAKVVPGAALTADGQVIELRMRNDSAGEYILARLEGELASTTVRLQTYNGSPGSTKNATGFAAAGNNYWRLIESNGDARLQVSTNGTSWSTIATITDHGLTDADLASMKLGMIVRAGDAGEAASARFDDVTVGAGFVDFGDSITWADASNPPAMGSDGTNLLVAERTSDNRIKIYEIDPRSPGRIVTTYTSGVSTDFAFVTPLATVAKGSFDFGSTRFIVTTGNSGDQWAAVFTVSGTTLSYQRNESFYIPGQAGGGWDGSFFQTLATDGTRRKHTAITWTDVSAWSKTWYAATTWYDGDATGGTHETTASPRAAFTFRKRSRYTVTSGDIPDLGGQDDPDRIKIYLASGLATSLYLQATTAAGVNSSVLTAATFSGTTAPVSNNFPTAIAAMITNAGGSLAVSGDGTIKGTTIEATTELKSALATLTRLVVTGWLTPVVVPGPTADTSTTNAEADVPQLTTVIAVPGTWARYRVVVDLAVGSFGSGTFTGYLNVDNVNNAKVITTAATASGNRQQPSRTYIYTGLSAGNHTFKVRAVSSAASPNNHRLYAGQCSLTIEQII